MALEVRPVRPSVGFMPVLPVDEAGESVATIEVSLKG
jgi:hypothetical protein